MTRSGPDLPRLHLTHGPHRLEVFDPRPDPLALGTRYLHGCYVAAWWCGERCLTTSPVAGWDPRVGQGLPEVFEHGLGWGAAAEGEEFLRIGSGRLRRSGRDWPQSGGTVGQPVAWTVEEHRPDRLVMRCQDQVRIGPADYGYELARTITLDHDGPTLRSHLRLRCPWSHPLLWFAHPFFAHKDGSGTIMQVPAGARPAGLPSLVQDRLHLPAAGGFGPITGIWGTRPELRLDLDPRLGGGAVAIQVDRPLDKLIVYATSLAFSVEPYLARAWHDGEADEWTVRYRWGAGC